LRRGVAVGLVVLVGVCVGAHFLPRVAYPVLLLPPYVILGGQYVTRQNKAGPPPRASRFATVATVLVGIAVGLFVLGALASAARNSPGYYLRHGTLVHADTSAARCGVVELRRNGALAGVRSAFCDDATWRAGGVTVTGSVNDDSLTANLGGADVPAYAIGNRADAAKGIARNPLVPLGSLPATPLLLPLPGLVLAAIVYAVAHRLRSGARSRADASQRR
jgi:hypothetical protein